MFIQVHYLTSYHATLLNRDDAGLAKRIVFGGAPRLRVSSQCLKRHWRSWMMDQTELPSGVRTRHFFGRIIKPRLMEAGLEEDRAHNLTSYLASKILTSAGSKDAVDSELNMKQPVLFGKPEADYLVGLILEADRQGDEKAAKSHLDGQVKEMKRNFQALLRQAGLNNPAAGFESALFGRFVTSDILSRVDAPVHVSHAFTVHALETEVDFFTVVDDLSEVDETGAAHANDMELGAGIFYGYTVIDIPLLVSNLTGESADLWRDQDPSDAQSLLRLLIRAMLEVSPGAKLGATAPYARAETVVLEVGDLQPRSLANAYLEPVRMNGNTNPMIQATEAVASYISALEQMYGDGGERRFVASLHPWSRDDEVVVGVNEAIERCLAAVFGGST